MRLKYYLRGLSVGIILTVIIMMIASSGRKNSISDEEVIKRARQLGMVMQEEKVSGLQNAKEEQENQKKEQAAKDGASQEDQKNPDTSKDSETSKDTEKKPESDDSGKEKGSEDAEDASKTGQPQGTGQEDTGEPEYVNIEVAQGEFSDKISQKLFAVGLIDDPTAFNRYLIDSGADGRITVGVHSIPKGASKEEIAGILCEKVK